MNDGRLAYLDFGMCGTLDTKVRLHNFVMDAAALLHHRHPTRTQLHHCAPAKATSLPTVPRADPAGAHHSHAAPGEPRV